MTESLSKNNSRTITLQEENLIDWNEVLKQFQKTFGNDIYESWIKNVHLE